MTRRMFLRAPVVSTWIKEVRWFSSPSVPVRPPRIGSAHRAPTGATIHRDPARNHPTRARRRADRGTCHTHVPAQLGPPFDDGSAIERRPRGAAAAALRPALDRQSVTEQDGLGQQATALLTLAFLLVKQVIAGDHAGGWRGGQISPSRHARRGSGGNGVCLADRPTIPCFCYLPLFTN